MFRGVNRSIRLSIKALEFRLRTLRNAREIARAYSVSPGRTPLPPKKLVIQVSGVLLTCLLAAVAVVVIQGIRPRSGGAARADARDTSETVSQAAPVQPPVSSPVPVPPPPSGEAARETFDSDAWTCPDTADFVLLANKADSTLHVMAKTSTGWRVRQNFPVAYGQNGGRKERHGDLKTPEGVYIIVGHKTQAELTKIYGPLAYVLNYPNRDDRQAGRTGQGIWIHGTAPDSLPVSTRGCLELRNDDIRELERVIGVGIGTPVVIADQPIQEPATFLDYELVAERRGLVMEDYQQKHRYFFGLIDEWRKAWADRDIDRYETFYDTSGFRAQGMGWREWRERKQATFRTYDAISVSIKRMFLSELTAQQAIVKFEQHYESNLLSSHNLKSITFVNIRGAWKIGSERTLSSEEFLL